MLSISCVTSKISQLHLLHLKFLRKSGAKLTGLLSTNKYIENQNNPFEIYFSLPNVEQLQKYSSYNLKECVFDTGILFSITLKMIQQTSHYKDFISELYFAAYSSTCWTGSRKIISTIVVHLAVSENFKISRSLEQFKNKLCNNRWQLKHKRQHTASLSRSQRELPPVSSTGGDVFLTIFWKESSPFKSYCRKGF